MVVDAALFLWSKAKSMFQKHQSGSSENPKYLQKMENPNKVNTLLKILIFFHFMIISISLCLVTSSIIVFLIHVCILW